MTIKPTNPKDAVGASKLQLELIPQTAIVEEALAYLEGACKYGRYNWRAGGVRTSIYIAALMRHLFKYWNGEDADPDTGVSHLGSMRACLGIIIDARECGKLTDDRPPPVAIGGMIARAEEIGKRVRALFASYAPKQWTIADDVNGLSDALAVTDAAQKAPGPYSEKAAL